MGQNRSPPRRLLMKSAILWRISRRFSWAVTTSYRAAEQVIQGQAVEAACQPARTPWQAGACRKVTGHAGASPVTLPVCDVSGMFFLMLCFCGYCSSSSSSFRSSPVYGFPGRPPGGAGCRERSQRSCLRPGGLPSLTQNPRLAATVPVAPPLSRRLCRAVA